MRVFTEEWRQLAHEKLDSLLNAYERGEPLAITTNVGWTGTTSTGVEDGELHMSIQEPWQ